jgi:dolichyl-phosphate beta-glucosyltransferase
MDYQIIQRSSIFNSQIIVAVMLDECLEYFAQRKNGSPNFTYEIIVVSDGSTDKTVELAHGYARQYSTNIIRVLELQPNRGKGGAVKMVRRKLKITFG